MISRTSWCRSGACGHQSRVSSPLALPAGVGAENVDMISDIADALRPSGFAALPVAVTGRPQT